MINLNSEPDKALKNVFIAAGITTPIYLSDEVPTAALPDTFIELQMNGAISSNASQLGFGNCVITISIYAKLLSSGATNRTKENLILAGLQTIFKDVISSSGFTFALDKSKLVYQGKSLISGYSTKMLNIITKLK